MFLVEKIGIQIPILVFKYQIRKRILISLTKKCECAPRACFIGSSRCDLPVFQGKKLFLVEKNCIQIPIFGILTERPRKFLRQTYECQLVEFLLNNLCKYYPRYLSQIRGSDLIVRRIYLIASFDILFGNNLLQSIPFFLVLFHPHMRHTRHVSSKWLR